QHHRPYRHHLHSLPRRVSSAFLWCRRRDWPDDQSPCHPDPCRPLLRPGAPPPPPGRIGVNPRETAGGPMAVFKGGASFLFFPRPESPNHPPAPNTGFTPPRRDPPPPWIHPQNPPPPRLIC